MSDIFTKQCDRKQACRAHEVYHSEEFKSFCAKFGIAWGLRTTNLTIHLPLEGLMTFTHEYQAGVTIAPPIIVGEKK